MGGFFRVAGDDYGDVQVGKSTRAGLIIKEKKWES